MTALSALTATTTLAATDDIYVLDGSNSRKADLSVLLDWIEANGAAPTTFLTSGTLADARVAASNVTQHQAALTITESQISDLGSYQTSDATLTALAAFNTNGILTQTAADTFAGRTITGTTDLITVTNGDGVSGNPTLTVGANVAQLAATQTLTNKTLTSPTINGGALSGTLTGAPTLSGNVVLTGSPDFSGIGNKATVRTDLGLAIGTDVQAFDADTLKADTADQLTAGFTAAVDDDGAAASPYAPDPDTGNYKRITNDGAMTINPPTMATGEATSITLLVTNTTGAGAITTSGFTAVTGDSFTTTTTDEFLCFIDAVDVGGTTYSTLNVVALQ